MNCTNESSAAIVIIQSEDCVCVCVCVCMCVCVCVCVSYAIKTLEELVLKSPHCVVVPLPPSAQKSIALIYREWTHSHPGLATSAQDCHTLK